MTHRVASALAVASLLLTTACAEDDPATDVAVTLGTARVSAQIDAPQDLASLEVTAQMEATVDLRGAMVQEVTLAALPDGPQVAFDVTVRGPQDAASIDLPAGDTVVARISNAGTTNADLQPLCGSAASMTIVVEVEGIVRDASRDLTVGCS